MLQSLLFRATSHEVRKKSRRKKTYGSQCNGDSVDSGADALVFRGCLNGGLHPGRDLLRGGHGVVCVRVHSVAIEGHSFVVNVWLVRSAESSGRRDFCKRVRQILFRQRSKFDAAKDEELPLNQSENRTVLSLHPTKSSYAK